MEQFDGGVSLVAALNDDAALADLAREHERMGRANANQAAKPKELADRDAAP